MLLLSLTFLQSTYGKVRFSEELFHLLLQSEYFGFVDLCELYRSKLRLFDIVTEKKLIDVLFQNRTSTKCREKWS